MTRPWPCLAFMLACGCGPAAVRGPAGTTAPAPVDQRFAETFGLIAHGADGSGAWRGLLARRHTAWLRLDGESFEPIEPVLSTDEVAVSEVRGDRVRVLHDADAERLLVWVRHDDLATVVVHQVELAGVTLRPGTPIAELGPGNRATIAIDLVIVVGTVGTEALGTLWEPLPTSLPKAATHVVDSGVAIRIAPAADAAVVATISGTLEVVATGKARDGWLEITTPGPRVIARGFVPADKATALEDGEYFGPYGLSGIGESGGLDVAAGTCLYDRPGGDVIGVTLADGSRVGGESSAGWYRVWIDTQWDSLPVALRVEGGGGERVRFERCTSVPKPPEEATEGDGEDDGEDDGDGEDEQDEMENAP